MTQLLNQTTDPYFSEHPQVVGIEITGRCPLRCKHCFNFSGPDNIQELSLQQIESVLDQMLTWNVKHLRISGGEPTYHRQFQEVISACEKRSITIAMNTNGVYSPTLLAYLKQAPIEIFLISVDGLEETNDAIRGRGIFKHAIHSCEQLKSAGKKVMISFHVGRSNHHEVTELIKLAAAINVDFKVSPMRPIGRAREELPQIMIQPAEYLAVVQNVVAMRQQYPHIKIMTDFDILDGPPISDCQKDSKAASCKAGRTMININYDGEIYPCAFFVTNEKEFSAGNIDAISLDDAWAHSPQFIPFRIHQKSATCQNCSFYQTKCAGGCPAISHFATGFLDAHDPTCFAKEGKNQ